MANINLLPWREELREERKKQFISMLALSGIVAAAIMLVIHLVFAQAISNQQEVNGILKKEIKVLDKKIKKIKKLKKEKEALTARMTIIEELQSSRPLTVKLFDEMVDMIPEGVYINSVKRADKRMTISGVAESNTLVSKLMRNIEAAELLTKAKLSEVKRGNKDESSSKTFKLSMQIKKQRKQEDSEGE